MGERRMTTVFGFHDNEPLEVWTRGDLRDPGIDVVSADGEHWEIPPRIITERVAEVVRAKRIERLERLGDKDLLGLRLDGLGLEDWR